MGTIWISSGTAQLDQQGEQKYLAFKLEIRDSQNVGIQKTLVF